MNKLTWVEKLSFSIFCKWYYIEFNINGLVTDLKLFPRDQAKFIKKNSEKKKKNY